MAPNDKKATIRAAESLESLQALSDGPARPNDSWAVFWGKMKQAGWKLASEDSPLKEVYIPPTGTQIKNGGEKGIDYFTSEDDVKQFAIDHLGWEGHDDGIEVDDHIEKSSSEWWKKHPIPAARQIWPILKNKLGFYHAGGLYRHPDGPKHNPQMYVDVFPDAQAMREYLAKTGIPNVESADLTDGERILIERWVATAYIPMGLDSNPEESVELLQDVTVFTDDQAWTLLSEKIGWRLVNDATSGEARYYKPEAPPYADEDEVSHGEDYFPSISEVRGYLRANGPFDVRYHYKWAFRNTYRRTSRAYWEIPCNVGSQEYIALTFWASMAPLPKHESNAIDAELSSRRGTPPLLAQEADEDCAHKPKVDNEASLAERPNSSSINDLSFEEIEKVYLEKKRERDDVIAAERLPFEKLEKIYRERKRQRTTVDLTEDNAGPFEPDETDSTLRNMAKQSETYSTKLVAVKKEIKDTKEDLEDANELVQQQTLTVDVWQSRFDELAKEPGLDAQKINEIRNRPLSSGR